MERVRAYCSMTGLELVDCYREEGISGSVPLSERPAGRRLVELVQRQRLNVVSLKLDSLFRDASDALAQTRAWDRAGVALHLVDMGGSTLNTASAMGRLFLTMTAAFAELERNLTRERTASALAYKRDRREVYGTTPLGYTREGDTLTESSEELELVQRMQQLRGQGWSLRQIAAALNAEGVPGKQGGRWHASTVRYVLANPLYQSA